MRALCSLETLKRASSWLEDLRDLNEGKKFTAVLVGNKNDLHLKRKVMMDEINRFCTKEKLTYIETSALTPVNVDEAFEKLCSEIANKQKRNGHRSQAKQKEAVCQPAPLSIALNGFLAGSLSNETSWMPGLDL